MEENMQHFGILCFIISKKVKIQLEHRKKTCAVCGEGAVTDQMCQTWLVTFRAGDFSLDNTLQSGRPVEVDSKEVETLRTINFQLHGR